MLMDYRAEAKPPTATHCTSKVRGTATALQGRPNPSAMPWPLNQPSWSYGGGGGGARPSVSSKGLSLALICVLFSIISLFSALQELEDQIQKSYLPIQISVRMSPSLTPDNWVECKENSVIWFTTFGSGALAGYSLSSRSQRVQYTLWKGRRKQLQGAVPFVRFLVHVKGKYCVTFSKSSNQE